MMIWRTLRPHWRATLGLIIIVRLRPGRLEGLRT
jgi:hypothetical protein